MPQDAFTIKYVAKELNETLTGGKISKITQPEKDLLIFIIYTPKGTVKLEICLSAKGCRINLANADLPAPKAAPNFCMLLRKHLQNAQITAVKQVEGERIVYFDLACASDFEKVDMRFYAELMGKYSNAVLTCGGIITGALKTTAISESTKRVLFTGAKYVLPEPQDKTNPEDLSALKALFENLNGDAAKFIADNVRGIAYSTAADIAARYGEKPAAEDVYRYICGDEIAPCVIYGDGEPLDFAARSSSENIKLYPNVLSAQTAYYAYICEKRAFEDSKRRLSAAVNSALKKVEKRLAAINQKLLDCRGAEDVKLKGELITANIYAVQRGLSEFEAVNYYDENGGKIKIALDKTLSPADNAQRYYKKYAKMKRTITSVTRQKVENEAQENYLLSIASHICAAENVCDLEETEEELKSLGLIKAADEGKKRTVKQTPFRHFVAEGYKITAGRNNLQNDRLLKDASPQYIWLHTRGYHSSHVIISAAGEAPESVLLVAAEICAYYSEGRGGAKISVDYCKRKSVKKPPKSPAGFVTYSDFKTILVQPSPHTELLINDKNN